jgi:transcription elongation factor Elf1
MVAGYWNTNKSMVAFVDAGGEGGRTSCGECGGNVEERVRKITVQG